MSTAPSPRAIVLIGVAASGTERRMAFVFQELARRWPGRYRLIINRGLFDILQQGGFALAGCPGVHVLEGRSAIDRKRGADAGLLVNAGRVITLGRYRRQIAALVRESSMETVQVLLEMVPALGLRPLRGAPMIASLVSHLPKYYESRAWSCRLLRRALRAYTVVDALYDGIARRVAALGVEASVIRCPRRNCVNHERFRPEPKEPLVTFTSRFLAFKNPQVMVDVAARLVRRVPDVRIHLMGHGPLTSQIVSAIEARGLSRAVAVGYLTDPAVVVNRSLVHVTLETYDNTTNQSLLEGMAAGCATVASAVGQTRTIVTPDVGRLTGLDAGEIAGAIGDLLERPAVAAALGAAGRARVLADHHVSTYADYLHDVHDRAAASAARR